MNKTKIAIAFIAFITSAQVMAMGTTVVNHTDYPIQFRAALRGGDINADWKAESIAPHTKKKVDGRMLLRFRYDVRVNYGDGMWRGVDFSGMPKGDASGSVQAGDEAGNREISIFRSDSGFWYLVSKVV